MSTLTPCCATTEAPWHLRQGGARVLRAAQRADARAKLAERPGGQLRPGAKGAPHRASWPSTGCYMYSEAGEADPRPGARRWPSAARRSRAKAEAGHQDPRAAQGVRGAAEVVRGAWAGVQGPRLAGLAHEIFLKLLKAKEVPGAAERQKTLAARTARAVRPG